MRTTLSKGEKVVMTTQKHPLGIFLLYALALALLVASIWFRHAKVGKYVIYLCLAAGIVSVIKTLSWQRNIWAVTNERVVDEHGILIVRCMDCPLDKITNVMVAESLPGRVLGYGKVQIQTAGELGMMEPATIMRPWAFRNAIVEQQEEFRETSGRTPTRTGEDSSHAEMKECPFCAEWIRARATICRFCNRELPPDN
jgi:uncharacterized membrane protein YdbT with pleckstrin-like domain